MKDMSAMTRRLAAARGDQPADLVLSGGRVLNLFNGQVESVDVAVCDGVVVGLGSYEGARRVELKGRYLLPGFIEGHLHVESTMLTPSHLAQLTCPRGTVAMFCDPHEIANVLGKAGVRAMLDDSLGLPVDFFFMAPSCVPATPLEDAGANLGPEQVAEIGSWPRVPGLAEMMNFPGAASGQEDVLQKLEKFAGRPIDGHAPLLGGKMLNAYLAAGPESDHECSNLDEAAEKLSRGMWVMIRQGTSAHNLADLLPLVNPVTERRCMLVSDDRHPGDLASKGHLDHLLRLAVGQGLDALSAVRMVTLNPVRRFGLHRRGAIAPGYEADMVVVDDLTNFQVRSVYKAGKLVAQGGEMLEPCARDFPNVGRNSMQVAGLSAETLRLPLAGRKARIIELIPGQLLTGQAVEDAPSNGGLLCADPARDLARLVVMERHHASGRMGQGLVRGLGLRCGALASSVAHDSHNLVVAAADDKSLLTAARRVMDMGGGLCLARGDEVLAQLPLPIAGLMSDAGLAKVLAGQRELDRAQRELCTHPEPFMALSFLCLPVIPSLKLTDRGLVDVNAFEAVDLFLP